MEKKLRILGLFAVAGAVALVMAQSRLSRSGSGNGAGTGTQIASGGSSTAGAYQSGNAIQMVLRWCLNSHANYEIELALSQNDQPRVDRLIKADDYCLLTLLRPDAQQHEIHDVWQVDKWVPNDPGWAAVARAPSLIHELLNVDQEVQRKVLLAWDKATDEMVKPLRNVEDRLMKEPGFMSLSQDEQMDRIRAEMEKVKAGKTKLQFAAESVKRDDTVLNYARSLLTPAQRAEFDGFVARHDQALILAKRGGTRG